MLIQRVITALVLLPLLLALVWYGTTQWVYAAFAAAGVVIAWEWSGLIAGLQRSLRAAYAVVVGVLLVLAWWTPVRDAWLPWLLALACLWWLAAPALFRGFPDNLRRHPLPVAAMAALGALLIVSTILSLAHLHAQSNGPLKLLFLLFLVFAADTGAFLAGRNLGRRKLAPAISPAKTVEGALGGLVLCGLWTLTAGVWVFAVQGSDVAWLLGLSIVVAIASIIGDLAESMFKRVSGIKDSGHILPGHGGLLDRVDSILAAAPVMVLGLALLGL